MAHVLLVAPGANPADIGEAWVGFQWARNLANRHTVTLVTYRKRSREAIPRSIPNLRVVEWCEPPLVGRAERFNSLFKPWYPIFYQKCVSWIRTALAQGEHFDVAHQPVPVAIRYPSPLAKFSIPYIIGPVGGSIEAPTTFESDDTAPWYVGLRRFDAFRLRHDRMLRRSYSRATVVLGIAPYVKDTLRNIPLQDFQIMSETGIADPPSFHKRDPNRTPVRLLFVGRLIRTKGARDAIYALAYLRDLPLTFDIVGDGFDRERCESLVRELGLQTRITFHGAVKHDRVNEYYRNADIFLFPSYREPGGNVTFEAMAHGLPVIVTTRGGPGYVVDDSSGIRVEPRCPDQFRQDLAQAVRTLVENPELRTTMGEAARSRLLKIGTWDQRMVAIDALYASAMSRGSRAVIP